MISGNTDKGNFSDSLYRQVMAEDFDALAPDLQHFHSLRGQLTLHGRCTVKGPETMLGRCLGRLFSLPKACAETSFMFELDADSEQETWRRRFPGRTMASRMHVSAGRLVEQLGPVALHFALSVTEGRLNMRLLRITCCGIACPEFMIPAVLAEETGADGKLYFNVAAKLPRVGVLAQYHGYLDLRQVKSRP
ncbi:DUF4166 domain-containing protein [Collimonas pratensis]|uniref:DUF4166 domain-containing protein n=1 Tax=Collimonas pratensis TaxID=279113 RepID=A0A127PZM0_9BURK|nr:DUF4166 domain-containing protein [Collimonas pratensis]AMP03045.1 hypothetical protein CPter91_0650 [Collimonas pratensis]